MPAPPAAAGAFGSGGKTSAERTCESQTPESLIRATRQVTDAFGIEISQSKVSRLVRRYKAEAEPKGFPFPEYVANGFLITASERVAVAEELRRAIAYADPTGETAVRNVIRKRGY